MEHITPLFHMITFNLHIFKYILLYENLLFLFNNMIFFLKWINKIKGNRSFYFVLFVNLIVHLNIQVFSRSYISSFPNNNRYCNHATSHANSKAFGLLPRGLSPYSMRVVLGSYEFEDLRSSSSQASPYKKRDNMNCLRVNSHNPYYLFFCTARAHSNVPSGNRTHN